MGRALNGELLTQLQAFAGNPVDPFWVVKDKLPGLDFNLEIVAAGTNERFPDGALGIRADADFYVVAALPLKFASLGLPDIVGVLWPQYADKAEFTPDSGTQEQEIYFLRERLKSMKAAEKHHNKTFWEQQGEIDRLTFGRRDIGPYKSSKKRRSDSYFVDQYTRLLVAIAHEHLPREDYAGICQACGLHAGDRVHMRHYIEERAAQSQRDPREDIRISHLQRHDDDED